MWNDVNEDWPFYTEEEKRMLKRSAFYIFLVITEQYCTTMYLLFLLDICWNADCNDIVHCWLRVFNDSITFIQ